ncbi:MAG TPA: heterodisulfide reductase-related iron-sulfur binding cluster [Spirochaetota bacterium]|nr:heterodisulfide reductase-related iron-sulfur binding cluster [Spirochaetota bacterium]HRZ26202.1 heterodisulfide reductase-related iron-sulfur binding cluster [Spirochaetota bacterium]
MNLAGSYGLPAADVTREFYFNVGGPHGFMRWGIYIFMFISMFYLIYTVVKKVLIWRQGKPQLRTDYPEKRLIAVVKYVMLQVKILREQFAGIMHASIFFGFIVLFIVTLIIVVQEDFTGLFFHYHFLTGNFYLIWSLFGDLFGLIVLIGLGMAIYRRYKIKPTRLDTKGIDTFALVLLAAIIVSGFCNEAMRIAITDFPEFEVWSPVGYVLAMPFSLIGTETLKGMHYINWWVHMLAAFSAIGLLATDKLGHIIISTLNVYYGNLENESAKTKYAVPVISPAEFETAETFGVGSVEQYTWKQLMDGDACTRCGRCQDNCPAYLTEKPLSPKKMINDVKANMDERIPKLMLAEDKSTVETTPLIDGAVQSDEFWSCTNCAACMEACPVNIEHVPKMIDMRRYKVLMEGDMAAELQTTFQNMESNFNPYGFAFAKRGEWLPADLGVKTLAEDPEVDYLYFVGCAASFDKRNQKVAIALLKVLKQAGLKIGILGSEEACCGDAAMRGGNEYLFHSLATTNLELFKAYGVKKIITTCPHGYNMLKKEYKKFSEVGMGSDGEKLSYNVEVFHHTEVIAELVKSGRIKLKEALQAKITYHDSCFLGRYNEIYEEPRDVIKAIPGTDYVEMSRNHRTSFCCGAGGARMFIEEHLGTRINQFRTKDAQASGANKICTACPFCMTMLSDGATELDIQNLETYDLAELVCNSMEK